MRVILAVLAPAVLLAGCNPPGIANDPAARAAIDRAMAGTAQGWNSGDMDQFMAAYSADADTSFVSGSDLLHGRDAIAARYRDGYDFASDATRGTLSFEPLDYRLIDTDHALYVARYTLTYPAAPPVSGLTSLVFARDDGDWKIIADHSS